MLTNDICRDTIYLKMIYRHSTYVYDTGGYTCQEKMNPLPKVIFIFFSVFTINPCMAMELCKELLNFHREM